jgi:hypothetical protein
VIRSRISAAALTVCVHHESPIRSLGYKEHPQ